MIKIATLQELMDAPVDYNIMYDAEDISADFEVGEMKYVFNGVPLELPFDHPKAHQLFIELTFMGQRKIGHYDVWKTNIINTGNAATIFATVADIIRTHYQDYGHKIKGYFFTAKEPSRKKLYHRLAKMITRETRLNRIDTEEEEGETWFYIYED